MFAMDGKQHILYMLPFLTTDTSCLFDVHLFLIRIYADGMLIFSDSVV